MKRIALALLLAGAIPTSARVRVVQPPPPLRLGEEHVVEANVELDEMEVIIERLRSASSGTESLLVWRAYDEETRQIQYTRIAADGSPLDATPKAIVVSKSHFDVTWDGEAYAVYADALVRVGRDGAIRSIAKIPEIDALGTLQGVSIASNGTNIALVVSSKEFELHFFLLDRAGRVLRHVRMDSGYREAVLVSDGENYLAAWWRSPLAIMRFGADGTVLDPLHYILEEGFGRGTPRAVWTGRGYLILWLDFDQTIQGLHVDRHGKPAERFSIDARVSGDDFAIAHANGLTAVVWKTLTAYYSRGVFTRRTFGTAATLIGGCAAPRMLDPEAEVDLTGQRAPAPVSVLPAGNGFTVVWGKQTTPENYTIRSDLFASRFTCSGEEATAHRVTTRVRPASYPSVAEEGVIWNAGRSIWLSIRGKATRLTEDGDAARLGWNGVTYVAAWLEDDEIRITRFSRDGEVLDASPLVVARGYSPLLACRAGECVIAWRSEFDSHARRIDASGAFLDAAPMLFPKTSGIHIATNGTEYLLLILLEYKTPQAIVLHEGVVRETIQFPGAFDYSTKYAVASDGKQWLIVTLAPDWIFTIDSALTVHTHSLPRPRWLPNTWPSLHAAWDGRNYLVAANRFLMRVRADGSIVERPIDTGEIITAVGPALIAYTRMEPAEPYLLARRVYTRTVTE